ncbi:MAG TPA: hypothetical protein VGX94_16660, partial [Terriglobia bacterium]|nr:hypothetical protein [Terriglobia bacterium]
MMPLRIGKISCWAAVILTACLCAVQIMQAQNDQSDQSDQGNPPARVARVSYISGKVSLQQAGVDQWSEASLNYPMTTNDRLYTDQGAR